MLDDDYPRDVPEQVVIQLLKEFYSEGFDKMTEDWYIRMVVPSTPYYH